MNVYVFRKFNKKISPMDKKNMLFRAFSHYKKTGNIDENCDLITLKIFKTEKGKPYIENNHMYFNISHSENLWICAIWRRDVGIDVQVKKKIDFMKFASRYFTRNEIEFLKECDSDKKLKKEFYRIWTMKEAIVKLNGESIFSQNKKYEVVRENSIVSELGGVCCSEVMLDDNFQCCIVYRTLSDEEININLVNL